MARVPPGHWGAVRAPGRGASGVAGGRAERPGQRPRLCRAHRFTKCICVSPPLMPFSLSPAFCRRGRQPAAVSPPNPAHCAASGISTHTRPAGCFCVDALPHCGTAPPEPRSRNIGFPHCVSPRGTRWEIRGSRHLVRRRRSIWRCIGGLFLRVGIRPFRAAARLQFFIPVSGQQGPLLRGIVDLPEGSRLQGKIRGPGRLLF